MAREEEALWSYCSREQSFLQGKRAMLSVAWLYRQDEVEAEPPLPECDPREVRTEVAQRWSTPAVQHSCARAQLQQSCSDMQADSRQL